MDNRVHRRRSQRQLLTRSGTFSNKPDDPFYVTDSDEEDIDDVNDQVIDQGGDQVINQGGDQVNNEGDDQVINEGDQVINEGGDQGGDQVIDTGGVQVVHQGMDRAGDQVGNEIENNKILNVHDNAVPTKEQGEKVPVETSSGIKRWTKSLISSVLGTPKKSHITPIITRDDNASSSKKKKRKLLDETTVTESNTCSSKRKKQLEKHDVSVCETRSSKKKKAEISKLKPRPTKKRKASPKFLNTPSVHIKSQCSKPKRSTKKSKMKKKRAAAPRVAKEKILSLPTLNVRTSPKTMYAALRSLSDEQKEAVRDMGFANILDMKLSSNSSRIGHYIVEALDDQELVIRSGKGDIKLTIQVVKDILGVPDSGLDIEELDQLDATDPIVTAWKKQFESTLITKQQIVEKISESRDGGVIFKLNFIILFVNCICKSYKTGFCMTNLVNKIGGKVDISGLNWCSFVLDCVKGSKRGWLPNSSNKSYAGPIIFLLLAYLHYIKGPRDKFSRSKPAICNWGFDMVKDRENMELRYGGFGDFTLPVQEDIEEELRVEDTEVDSTIEGLIVDIKAKLARIPRYKSELIVKFMRLFEGSQECSEIVEIQKEYDSLFGIAQMESDKEDSDYSGIDERSEDGECFEKKIIFDPVENSKHDHLEEPATPVGTVNNRTPPATSSQKHPLDSPVSPYVLQMISEIEASAIRSSEERFRNSKIQNIEKIKQPNFDLGEEFQSPIKANVVKPNPVVQSTRVSPFVNNAQVEYDDFIDDIPLSKRFRRPSIYKCSPYYRKQVECLDLVKDIEFRVSQYLFSSRGEPNYPVFELPDGSCMSRIVMESLMPDTWVAIDVLNAWSIVLNHEEELKSKDVPNRVFLSVFRVDDDMLKPEVDTMKGYKQFDDMMQQFNNRWDRDDNFKKAHLMYCPVFCYDHYFLFVFDLKKNKVHIIDNRKWMVLEDYGILPELMVRYLSTYLTTIKNPFGARIRNEVPKVARMTCQTKNNGIDCGIFVMRHMESYKGGPFTKYDSGLLRESEEQRRLMWKMRKKYATKIIMCELNKLINVVLTEANEFGKIGAAERRAILVQAYRNREERMKLL